MIIKEGQFLNITVRKFIKNPTNSANISRVPSFNNI